MLELYYPRFSDENTTTKQGGLISNNKLPEDKNPASLFSIGIIKDSGNYTQYRKVFVKNNTGSQVNNLRLNLTNKGASIISYALERDLDGLLTNGGQVIRNAHIEPGRLVSYDWITGGYDDTLFSSESSSTEVSESSSSGSTEVQSTQSSSSESTEAQSSSSSEDSETSSSSSTLASETSSYSSVSQSSKSSESSSSSSISSESTEQSESSSSSSLTESLFSSASSSSSTEGSSSSTEASVTSESSSTVASESSLTSSLSSSSTEVSNSSSSTEASETSSSSSSSSSESDFLIGTLEDGEAQGIWLRMQIPDTETYTAEDSFCMYFTADETQAEYAIPHARAPQSVGDVIWQYLNHQTDFVRVKFDSVVDNTFFRDQLTDVFYAAVVNGVEITEFSGLVHDIFIRNIDSIFTIDLYFIPHLGFDLELAKPTSGVNACIQFKAKRPDIYDIDRFLLFTDNATGTITDEIVGEVKAETAIGGGKLILDSKKVS